MATKRQQTMAKRAREQKVKEKRARKAEKKQAVQEAKAAGLDPWAHRLEGVEPTAEGDA